MLKEALITGGWYLSPAALGETVQDAWMVEADSTLPKLTASAQLTVQSTADVRNNVTFDKLDELNCEATSEPGLVTAWI